MASSADSGISSSSDKVGSGPAKETPAGSTLGTSEHALTLWTRAEGDADYAIVTANSNDFVGLLKEHIATKLMLTERRSSITLHIEDVENKELGKALDSTETIEEALRGRTGKIRLTIKVAGAAVSATQG